MLVVSEEYCSSTIRIKKRKVSLEYLLPLKVKFLRDNSKHMYWKPQNLHIRQTVDAHYQAAVCTDDYSTTVSARGKSFYPSNIKINLRCVNIRSVPHSKHTEWAYT